MNRPPTTMVAGAARDSVTHGRRRDRRSTAVLAFLLGALTMAVFSQTLGNDFIHYDDNEYVTENRQVLDGLSLAGLRWAATSLEISNWHPLTWLSHMADVELFGLRPWGHHLTSVLLHSSSAAILFLVLHGMTGARWRSALVAALFAVHPLHVQSVAWVAERKDVLSGLFWFLCMGAYLRYTRSPSRMRYLPVAAFLALSLAAKAMAVTLPAVLLLLDYWPLARINRRTLRHSLARRCIEKIPLLLLSLAGGALALVAQLRGEAIAGLDAIPLGVRIWNASLSFFRYTAKALLPQDLSVYYPHPGAGLAPVRGIVFFIALVIISMLAWRASRSRGYTIVGWFWFLVTLLPVIGLMQIGPQSIADRYTYLPLVGLFILAVWTVADAADGRVPRSVLSAISTAVVLILAGLAWRETGFWKNSLTLANHSMAAVGDNGVLLTIKGTFLSRSGRFDEAIPVLRKAAILEPSGPYTNYNLASALARAGQTAEAVKYFRISLENNPTDAEAHLGLGVLLAQGGSVAEGIDHLRTAVRLAPDHHVSHRELSRALERVARIDEALEHARKATALAPLDPQSLAQFRRLYDLRAGEKR